MSTLRGCTAGTRWPCLEPPRPGFRATTRPPPRRHRADPGALAAPSPPSTMPPIPAPSAAPPMIFFPGFFASPLKLVRVGRQRNDATTDLDVGQLERERGLAPHPGPGLGLDDAPVGAGAARGDHPAVRDQVGVQVALEALACFRRGGVDLGRDAHRERRARLRGQRDDCGFAAGAAGAAAAAGGCAPPSAAAPGAVATAGTAPAGASTTMYSSSPLGSRYVR